MEVDKINLEIKLEKLENLVKNYERHPVLKDRLEINEYELKIKKSQEEMIN